jgi:preprotein translocase subunit SecE
VAENTKPGRRARIRKTAPTVRERQEAALAQDKAPKKRRVRSLASKVASPVKKLRLRDRKAVKVIIYPFRLLGRILYKITPKYFVNSWRELRQVVWPSRKETWRLTLAVFVFALVFGGMVAIVDRGLDQVFKEVILK